MALRNIAIIGGNGKLGPSIIDALLAADTFTVTVLQRASSKSAYPPAVNLRVVPDDLPEPALTTALAGQDALIVALSGALVSLQKRLADAASRAGVSRFIPADFGSCDSSSAHALALAPLYGQKADVRAYLISLASRSALSWTSIVCGHFFDWGLASGLLHFDVRGRRARVFDGGDARWSASTLARIALAVVRVLQRPGVTRNRMLYVQSFCVSQNEVLGSLERVVGGEWAVERVDARAYMARLKARLEEAPDDHDAMEELVGVGGLVEADWEGKEDFANGLLGLEGEDLDRVVKGVVDGL